MKTPWIELIIGTLDNPTPDYKKKSKVQNNIPKTGAEEIKAFRTFLT